MKRVAVFSLVIFLGAPALAADGASLFKTKTCVTCHGEAGNAPIHPAYPKLAGQQKGYLVAQMKAFRAKARTNGNAPLMWGMAANLSDEEIEAIAEYLAAQ